MQIWVVDYIIKPIIYSLLKMLGVKTLLKVLLYKDIHHTLIKGSSYSVSHHDCLQSIRLLHAFYRSNEKNGWQKVNEDGESIYLGQENNEISNLYRTIK